MVCIPLRSTWEGPSGCAWAGGDRASPCTIPCCHTGATHPAGHRGQGKLTCSGCHHSISSHTPPPLPAQWLGVHCPASSCWRGTMIQKSWKPLVYYTMPPWVCKKDKRNKVQEIHCHLAFHWLQISSLLGFSQGSFSPSPPHLLCFRGFEKNPHKLNEQINKKRSLARGPSWHLPDHDWPQAQDSHVLCLCWCSHPQKLLSMSFIFPPAS